MSDEHAPLRLLRQVFGGDIIRVMSDDPLFAEVQTETHGEVRLVQSSPVRFASVNGCGAEGYDFHTLLRDVIACRASLIPAEIRRLERQAVALDRLRVPVPE